MTAPMLSVVIPTKNGGSTLGPLFESLRRQYIDRPAEIIVVDSGSTDATRDLANTWADQVLDVPADQFNHGTTRNIGVGASHGELVVLVVQDALPASDDLLRELTRPMRDDDRVAGTFARQVARPDASAITRYYLDQWVASNGSARTAHLASRTEYDALDPMQRFRLCAFDNVCACIRRSVWETLPFVRTPIAEDVTWGRAALLAGWHLAYTPNAVVIHSHDRTVAYEFDRTRRLHQHLHELFGLQTIPTKRHLARAVVSSLTLHLRLERRSPAHLLRAVGLAFAWPLGQHLGARAGARGQTPIPMGPTT